MYFCILETEVSEVKCQELMFRFSEYKIKSLSLFVFPVSPTVSLFRTWESLIVSSWAPDNLATNIGQIDIHQSCVLFFVIFGKECEVVFKIKGDCFCISINGHKTASGFIAGNK